MNVLIVGAGALGQVFGLYLTRGGASVSYVVRPAQAALARICP
jgi:2-dehydropantoate 2-reductase